VIVLDWTLPDVAGIEVSRSLRREGSTAAILFLTARGSIDDKIEALLAGGDDYVTKPFTLAEVVARVEALLSRAGRGVTGAPHP